MNEEKPLDVPAWREAIAWAREPELGDVHWPRVLGWALDEIERLRVRVPGWDGWDSASVPAAGAADTEEARETA